MNQSTEKYLDYDDILLVPKFSDIKSRRDVDITSFVTPNVQISTPIVSAPMTCVTGRHLAIALHEAGGIGIIPRFMTIHQQCMEMDAVRTCCGRAGAAVGATGDYLERAQALTAEGASFLVIDVAHGDHQLVMKALNELRRTLSIDIMAGNVVTAIGARHLASVGASCIRVGVGPGAGCTTRTQTGHGMPQLSAIEEVAEEMNAYFEGVTVCADGGIKNAGDICKALAFGADTVMLGKMFAATEESPAEKRGAEGNKRAFFYGQASTHGKAGLPKRFVEGRGDWIYVSGTVQKLVTSLTDGIRSGFSYSGANNLNEFRHKIEYIEVNNVKG